MNRVIAVCMLSACSATLAAEDPLAWLDREKVRAAYHYGRPPISERLARLQQAGINCLVLKCPTETALPWAREAGAYGIRCFTAFNFNVRAEQEGFRPAVLADGRTEAYACPLDDRFWQDYLTPALLERAALGARPDLNVVGLWIDFELYSTRSGQRYYTNACYCEHCLAAFCTAQGVAAPDVPPAARAPWLAEHGWGTAYQPFLQGRIEAQASALRRRVHAVCPGFLLGFYPTPANWSLVGVARGFSTPEVPILIWGTQTYSGGGAERIPLDWRPTYAAQGINARYIAGMLLRCYSARNLAAHLYAVSGITDGYWLFTTYTLTLAPEEQKGDYYLAAGTPAEYWAAIARGNREILARQAAGSGYDSGLTVGPEPIVYHALSKPELRRRLQRLTPPERHAAGVAPSQLPTVLMRGANAVVLPVQAGEPLQLTLAHHPVRDGKEPIAWRLIDVEGTCYAEGHGNRGAAAEVAFTPTQSGILYLVASAESSCWSVARCNLPFGLYAGSALHLMSKPSQLYFRVPAGTASFAIRIKGGSLRETVRAVVHDPTGREVAAAHTDDQRQQVEITVTRQDTDSATWSVTLSPSGVGIFEDHFLELPEPLAPVLGVLPEHAW